MWLQWSCLIEGHHPLLAWSTSLGSVELQRAVLQLVGGSHKDWPCRGHGSLIDCLLEISHFLALHPHTQPLCMWVLYLNIIDLC